MGLYSIDFHLVIASDLTGCQVSKIFIWHIFYYHSGLEDNKSIQNINLFTILECKRIKRTFGPTYSYKRLNYWSVNKLIELSKILRVSKYDTEKSDFRLSEIKAIRAFNRGWNYSSNFEVFQSHVFFFFLESVLSQGY